MDFEPPDLSEEETVTGAYKTYCSKIEGLVLTSTSDDSTLDLSNQAAMDGDVRMCSASSLNDLTCSESSTSSKPTRPTAPPSKKRKIRSTSGNMSYNNTTTGKNQRSTHEKVASEIDKQRTVRSEGPVFQLPRGWVPDDPRSFDAEPSDANSEPALLVDCGDFDNSMGRTGTPRESTPTSPSKDGTQTRQQRLELQLLRSKLKIAQEHANREDAARLSFFEIPNLEQRIIDLEQKAGQNHAPGLLTPSPSPAQLHTDEATFFRQAVDTSIVNNVKKLPKVLELLGDRCNTLIRKLASQMRLLADRVATIEEGNRSMRRRVAQLERGRGDVLGDLQIEVREMKLAIVDLREMVEGLH